MRLKKLDSGNLLCFPYLLSNMIGFTKGNYSVYYRNAEGILIKKQNFIDINRNNRYWL